MTVLVFNLEAIDGSESNVDAVEITVPEPRPSAEAPKIIVPRSVRFTKEDADPKTGDIRTEVRPGPIEVEIVAGHRSFFLSGHIPDTEEYLLSALFSQGTVLPATEAEELWVAIRNINAEPFAEEAAASAGAAKTSETNAASSASTAASIASSASASKNAAAASASAAKTSETNAATSATNSADSAATATEQAGVAAGHADTARASAAAAAESEANAKMSEQAAKQAETNAKSSEERVATIAGSTRWVGTKLEVNGQLSPDLKGDLPVVYSSTPPEDKNVIWVNPDEELPAQDGTPAGGGASGPVSWESVTGKPSEFTPTAHTHTIGDTTGLQSELDGKAPTTHAHAIADTTGLQTALDGKADKSTVTGLQTALDSKADKSHTHTVSQISDATTTGKNVLIASSQAAARSAIGAGTSNLGIGTTSTTAAAGNHTHTPADIGAAPATHTHAIGDVTGLQAALDGKVNASQIQIVPTIPSTTTPGTVYITTV